MRLKKEICEGRPLEAGYLGIKVGQVTLSRLELEQMTPGSSLSLRS